MYFLIRVNKYFYIEILLQYLLLVHTYMHVCRHTNTDENLIYALKIEIIWLQRPVYGTLEGRFFFSNTFHLYTTDS